jgi:hypothetical protein
MPCESKFTSDVSLSCILGWVADARKGVTTQTITQALWIGGCLVTKLAPSDASSDTPEVGTMSCASLESLLDDLECKCNELEQNVSATSFPPSAGTQGWEVLIPVIFEIIKMIIENRQKKQQPKPDPKP